MSGLEMETVACDYCGSSETSFSLAVQDTRYHLPGDYTIVRCKNCGLVYTSPRPTSQSIGDAYPATYHAFTVGEGAISAEDNTSRSAKLRDQVASAFYWHKARYSFLQKIILSPVYVYSKLNHMTLMPPLPSSGGRVLDIGCGAGRNLYRLKGRGWSVIGIEPDAAAAERARTLLDGSEIHVGILSDVSFEPASFDMILVSHVLEHVHNPLETLRRIFDLLKPGGFLLILVPNFNCVERKLTNQNWEQMDMPRHLYFYEPKTLRRYLEETGFRVNAVQATSEAWAFRKSVLRQLKEPQNKLLTGSIHLTIRAVSFTLTLLNSGNVMTFYASKP